MAGYREAHIEEIADATLGGSCKDFLADLGTVPLRVDSTREHLVRRLEDGRSLSLLVTGLAQLRAASRNEHQAYERVDDGEEFGGPVLNRISPFRASV